MMGWSLQGMLQPCQHPLLLAETTFDMVQRPACRLSLCIACMTISFPQGPASGHHGHVKVMGADADAQTEAL